MIEERVSGTATKSYVWSPVYVDAMVARDRDTDANGSLDERLYVMHDANFNVTGLVNTSGTVVERYTYDPYGVATIRDGSWTVTTTAYAWQYLHQGGRLSFTSDLYYFRNRDYSPTLGRFTSMDPLGYGAGDQNVYRYEGNGPGNHVDPSGLDFWSDIKIYAQAAVEVSKDIEFQALSTVFGTYGTLRGGGNNVAESVVVTPLAIAGKALEQALNNAGEVYNNQRAVGENVVDPISWTAPFVSPSGVHPFC